MIYNFFLWMWSVLRNEQQYQVSRPRGFTEFKFMEKTTYLFVRIDFWGVTKESVQIHLEPSKIWNLMLLAVNSKLPLDLSVIVISIKSAMLFGRWCYHTHPFQWEDQFSFSLNSCSSNFLTLNPFFHCIVS